MIIKINMVGKSEFSNWCTFDAVVNEFFTISGIANFKDFELEENTTYKDLYLQEYKNKKGNIVFSIFKKN